MCVCVHALAPRRQLMSQGDEEGCLCHSNTPVTPHSHCSFTSSTRTCSLTNSRYTTTTTTLASRRVASLQVSTARILLIPESICKRESCTPVTYGRAHLLLVGHVSLVIDNQVSATTASRWQALVKPLSFRWATLSYNIFCALNQWTVLTWSSIMSSIMSS